MIIWVWTQHDIIIQTIIVLSKYLQSLSFEDPEEILYIHVVIG